MTSSSSVAMTRATVFLSSLLLELPEDGPKSLDEVDPKLIETYNKLGIPLEEQKLLAGVTEATEVAVDAVFDSVSVKTTYSEKLAEGGAIL